MAYTAPTLAEAQTALASRLNDQGFVHWVEDELTLYLREALRTWNAWTAHWRDRGTLTISNPDVFADLSTGLSGSLRAQTVTTWEMVADLQYALLEPAAAGGTWTGTDQFDLAQLSTALQRRLDQFLRETGCQQTRAAIPFAAPAAGRLTLDEEILIVRRAAWHPLGGWNRPLLLTDSWAASAFLPTWRTASDTVRAYSTSDTPPLEFQLIPPPSSAGTLDLVSINKSTTVDPLVSTLLGIPDDWAWVVKWGALADLLSGDGLALDPGRAQYCEQRWQLGLDLLVRAPVILNAYTDSGAVVQLAALNEADTYSPTWQLVPGTPRRLLTAGSNLVAAWPPPNLATTFTLDVVRNAPVPSLPADILQLSADVYDVVLDYAQHLALFKQGPGELEMSQALFERCARAAGIETQVQQASQPSRAALLRQQAQDGDAKTREQLTMPV